MHLSSLCSESKDVCVCVCVCVCVTRECSQLPTLDGQNILVQYNLLISLGGCTMIQDEYTYYRVIDSFEYHWMFTKSLLI